MAYIYKITNSINGKIYIGKTYKTIEQRFKEHFKDSKRYKNRPLYRAINKYGIESFKIEVIEKTNTPEEREKYIKVIVSCISRSCKNNNTAYGYKWSFL